MTDEQKAVARRQRATLRKRGFDKCVWVKDLDRGVGYWRVGCSRCQVVTIQGMACHETGCPNSKRTRR